ncbi:unnamed protein product, partial [Rotaria magnacalcarata]
ALAVQDDDLGKRKLLEFESKTSRNNQAAITNADSSRQGKGVIIIVENCFSY